VSLIQRVSCYQSSARHYYGDGGGSVPRKTAMYTSVTVQLAKLFITCPWNRPRPSSSRETDAMWWFVKLQVN